MKAVRMTKSAVAIAATLAIAHAGACTVDEPTVDLPDATAPIDSGLAPGTDAAVDARSDATVDASTDASNDARSEATVDASTDASTDASPDANDGSADTGVDAGPQSITVLAKDFYGVLSDVTWAAWQDGPGGAWTRVSPSATGTFRFTTTAPKYGFALVCSDGATAIRGGLFYRTTTTTTLVVDACTTAPQTNHTLGGTFMNLPVAANTLVSGGLYKSMNVNAGSASYVLFNFVQGKNQDIGLAISDSITAPNILKLLVLRNQPFATDVTRDVDWNVEGVAPGPAFTATVTNATANTPGVGVNYASTLSTRVLALNKGITAKAGTTFTQEFHSVPAAFAVAATDDYEVAAIDGTGVSSVYRRFKAAANVSVAMPGAPTATFAVAATTPYFRPRYSFGAIASPQGYGPRFTHFISKFDRRDFTVDIDPSWLSGPAPYTFDFPDFSGVTGWQNAWAPPPSAATGVVEAGLAATSKTTFSGGFEIKSAETRGLLP